MTKQERRRIRTLLQKYEAGTITNRENRRLLVLLLRETQELKKRMLERSLRYREVLNRSTFGAPTDGEET